MSHDRTVHQLDRRGLVRDWLVGPSWAHACEDLGTVVSAEASPWGESGRWSLTNGPDVAPLKTRIHEARPMVLDQPLPAVVEGGPIRWQAPGGDGTDVGVWRREHVGWDGFVDWSHFSYTPEYRHAVAATVIELDQAGRRTLEVISTGPVALWCDDDLVLRTSEFSYMEPLRHRVERRFQSGTTRLFLATWQLALREVRHFVGIRVLGLPVRVVIPSPGADEHTAAVAERLLSAVGVSPWAATSGQVRVTGPAGAALQVAAGDRAPVPLRLVGGEATLDLDAVAPAEPTGEDDTEQPEAAASMLASGETTLTFSVDDPRAPVARRMPVATLPGDYRPVPQGDGPAQWRRELLEHAAAGVPSTARALARFALDPDGTGTDAAMEADLAPALHMVEHRADCADFEAVGLLDLWHRVPALRWPDGLRDRVRHALLGFKYWIDQPGLDAMCYFTENHQMVWHTAELLAGETFAEETFSNAGWTGTEHAAHAREQASEWIRRKLTGGFSEFDSNAYLAIDALALVSLVDHARDPELRMAAEALLDKTLLTLASNSWRGVHGAAHGRSYTTTLRSSRFEETAPIMWLLWGTGSLNAAVLPATLLATSTTYELPPLVRAVANQAEQVWDGRQVYRGRLRGDHDLLDRHYESDLRIHRTPEVMLASVQDYRAGLPGLQEHVWGVTLGPETQLFATHPAAFQHGSTARPNAWAGHRVLPRARQHRDVLLALHRIPEDDLVDRTHVWFPVDHLDEHQASGCWLVGRVAEGYVALATAGGFEMVTTGPNARQEWRPRGSGHQYVVTVGSARQHGALADFISRLEEPDFGHDEHGEPWVRWRSLHGELVEMGWTTPLLVDGADQDLDPDGRIEEPPHLANPAVTVAFGEAVLRASWAGESLELDLEKGRRLVPASGVGG